MSGSSYSKHAILLVLLMIGGATLPLIGPVANEEKEELEIIEQPMAAPTNPGHTVFAQYITSDDCVNCYQHASPAHIQAKNSLPNNYVYIAYHSASFGNTGDAESGNISPIYAMNHLQEYGGAPKTSFGDANLSFIAGIKL